MRNAILRGAFAASLFLILGASACTKSGQAPSSDLVSRGRVVYQSNCIACHHTDPKKSGTLGPEVFGASLELLEARILSGDYPAGYKPKRQTRSMVPIPQLKADLPALHAFLNAN